MANVTLALSAMTEREPPPSAAFGHLASAVSPLITLQLYKCGVNECNVTLNVTHPLMNGYSQLNEQYVLTNCQLLALDLHVFKEWNNAMKTL